MYKRNSNTDKARSIYNKLYTDNCIFRYKQAEYIEVITVVAWLELWKGCAEEFGTTGSQIPEAEDFLPRSSRSGKWSNNDRQESRVWKSSSTRSLYPSSRSNFSVANPDPVGSGIRILSAQTPNKQKSRLPWVVEGLRCEKILMNNLTNVSRGEVG